MRDAPRISKRETRSQLAYVFAGVKRAGAASKPSAPTAEKATAKTQCQSGPVVNPGPYDGGGCYSLRENVAVLDSPWPRETSRRRSLARSSRPMPTHSKPA